MPSPFSARDRDRDRDRRRAIRDLERRMAELDRLDREYGLGAMPDAAPLHRAGRRAARERRRAVGPALPALLISALVLAGVVAFSPGETMDSVRRLVGLGLDRLGAAPAVPDGDGKYSFSQTQRGSDEPVGYSPCRPIEIAVNPDGAPGNYEDLVDTAIAHTSKATGLRFERVGLTDDRNFTDRYSGFGEPPPAVVAWADADEVPDLEGDVAGIGGSVAVARGTGPMRYVTGMVVLDRAVFDNFGPFEQASAQAIVDHEFGHLVGLGHVDDGGELMYDKNLRVTTYGPGDLEGLARLGNVSC